MFTRLYEKVKRFFWLLPALLMWASFPPMGEQTDILFAIAPLLWLARKGDAKRAARDWFLCGLAFWGGTLAWMPAIIKNNGPWPLVVLGWGALSAYCALFLGAAGWLTAKWWAWAKGYGWRLLGLVVIEPVIWAGFELLRSRLFGGFAWNQLGVVAVNAGFGSPAALGGVYLLSIVIVMINGTFASIAERMVKGNRGWCQSIETLLPLALVIGLYHLPTRPACAETRRPLRVALLQRNFPCCFATREESPKEVYERLLANVSPLRPDLVVLPESALSEFGVIGSRRVSAAIAWLQEQVSGAAILAGGCRQDAQGREFNSAALFPAVGSSPVSPYVYDKVHLVPFGEFIPGDKLIPSLQRLAPVGSCTPGEPALLPLRTSGPDPQTIPLGIAICYEDTDSALVRDFAARGAKALVFITNDSWFSHSEEAVAHSWHALARAVETGLPVIRVGNSGVTGVISRQGRATWLADASGHPIVDQAAAMVELIEVGVTGADGAQEKADSAVDDPRTPRYGVSTFNPDSRALTLYTRLGDGPLIFVFLSIIVGGILIKYKASYEQRRKLSL